MNLKSVLSVSHSYHVYTDKETKLKKKIHLPVMAQLSYWIFLNSFYLFKIIS
jgi:hypothetical protein